MKYSEQWQHHSWLEAEALEPDYQVSYSDFITLTYGPWPADSLLSCKVGVPTEATSWNLCENITYQVLITVPSIIMCLLLM